MNEEQDTKKQDEISSKQSSVLIVDSKASDTVEPDERFFNAEDEDDVVVQEAEEQPKKVFDKSMKKKLKKEQMKVDREIMKKKVLNVFKNETGFMTTVARIMDFSLNAFSIVIIIVAVLSTLNFLLHNNPIMTVVGCLFIWLTIYLNKQIS